MFTNLTDVLRYLGTRRGYNDATGRGVRRVAVFVLACSACGAFLAPTRAAIGQTPMYGAASADSTLQQLNAARKELRDAQQALDTLAEKLKTDLEKTDPEWAKLRKAFRQATEDRDKTREQVLSAARATPQYVEAKDSLEKARQTLLRLTDDRDTASREFDQADAQAFAMRAKIRELETNAINGSADLRDAEAKLESAAASMNDRWKQHVSQVLANYAPWRHAVSRQEQAEQAVQDAEAARSRAVAAQSGSSTGMSYGSRSRTSHSSSGSRSSSHGSSNRSY